MKMNIHIPASSRRTKILSAFMAFLIFALTFQQAFVGWEAGLRVKAAGDGNIHSSTTDKTSTTMSNGTTSDGYTYTGNYTNNNKVTLFDYVSDYELAHSYNTCNQKEEGYCDSYTTLNSSISGNLKYPSNKNITFIFKKFTSAGNLDNVKDVHIYLFNGSNNGSLGAWPGEKMDYRSAHQDYIYTVDNLSSYGPNTGVIIRVTWFDGTYSQSEDYNITINSSSIGKSYIFGYNGWNGSKFKLTQTEGTAHATTNSNTTSYTNPLYFGDFWMSDAASGYSSSNTPSYNNFYWQANMGLKPPGTNGSASVQGLVYKSLSGGTANGNLLDINGTTELPYFSKSWANSHSNIMKYYDTDSVDSGDITFPFYEVYKAASTSGEYARYYQFDSSKSTLQFTNYSAANHTGYFKESSTAIQHTGTQGFFPFNTSATYNNNSTNDHNLGFATKLEMNFQLESDG